jgi:arginyl-tRNA synthetase
MDHRTHLTNLITTVLTQHYQTVPFTITLNVDRDRTQFGDYSTNAPLLLAKALQKKPQIIAQEIINLIAPLDHQCSKMEIAGAGFINFFATPATFINTLQELIAQQEKFFKNSNLTPQKYNIEYVSANPTGPLHIGHGRGGIIGDVVSNVLTFLGHNVTREFYINDAGAQITKLGISFQARCLQQLGKATEIPEGGYQGEYLIELAQTCVQHYGQELLKHDTTWFSDYAKQYLQTQLKETLNNYGVTFDVWFSEKTLHESNAIKETLELLKHNNSLYQQEDGAWLLKSTESGDDKDRVVIKSDGSYTYIAADIAYLNNKITRGFNHLIMVLGQDHHSYKARLKAALIVLGHDPDLLDVILYQLVTLMNEGQALRMSKRAGRIVGLQDVITMVGKDIARFFYLQRKADAHLHFDIVKAMERTDNNPVYSIQYAYVRMGSILKKAAATSELNQGATAHDFELLTEHDHGLILKFMELKELLESIGRDYQVHTLTTYTLELTQLFHSYYAACKVIDTNDYARSRARLVLIKEIRAVCKLTMGLLGISMPESM